jgi:hypothetical protein
VVVVVQGGEQATTRERQGLSARKKKSAGAHVVLNTTYKVANLSDIFRACGAQLVYENPMNAIIY